MRQMYSSPPVTRSSSNKRTSPPQGWIAHGETAGSQSGGVQVCMCWGGAGTAGWTEQLIEMMEECFSFLLLWIESNLTPNPPPPPIFWFPQSYALTQTPDLKYWLFTLWAAVLSNTADCETKQQRDNLTTGRFNLWAQFIIQSSRESLTVVAAAAEIWDYASNEPMFSLNYKWTLRTWSISVDKRGNHKQKTAPR